jgi:hypothetical protein
MQKYTLQKAIQNAKVTMAAKIQKNLFRLNDEYINPSDDCDVETIWSLGSMYSQFVEDVKPDEAESAILDALVDELLKYDKLYLVSSFDGVMNNIKCYYITSTSEGVPIMEKFFSIESSNHPITAAYNWINDNGFGDDLYFIQVLK